MDSSISDVGMRVQGAGPSPGNGPSPELVEAAREFESLLLNMMMKSMRESVPENDLFGDGSKVRMYEEMRDTELAGVMARQGGIGLARLIVDQFRGREEEGLDALRQAGGGIQKAEDSYRANSRLGDLELLGGPSAAPGSEESR